MLQISELWGDFSQSSKCTSNPYLHRPVSSSFIHSHMHSMGLAPLLAKLDHLLLLTTVRLHYRCVLAGGTCLDIRGWVLPVLLLSADLVCSIALSSAWAQAWPVFYVWLLFLCRAPCPWCSASRHPGQGPKPRWSPQTHKWKLCGWDLRWGWCGKLVPIDGCPLGPINCLLPVTMLLAF